ncbi:MAG: heme A synthase [Leptolyngbyaceae cyanobacterium bins.59]|nr:heme A synthase [Leptolyngbyaceae cyanobacterium bins.59]
MANSVLHSVNNRLSVAAASPVDKIRRLVFRIAIATLILMAIGGATRVMNAGLACPDWPLCYGELVPRQQMNFQVFLEWFHRLDAAFVSLSTLGLVALSGWHRKQLPHWLPWASTLALSLILFQAVLGGLTVTELLRFDIVTAHLGTALLFFVTLLVIGMALVPYQPVGTVGKLPWVGLTAAVLIYIQSLLGALVASQWALHQCFAGFQLCLVMNGHIAGSIPATIATLLIIGLIWRTPALNPALRRLGQLAAFLVVFQVFLGVITFWVHLQVELLTIAHQTTGAALLGTLVSFTVLALRDRAFSRQALPLGEALQSSTETQPQGT